MNVAEFKFQSVLMQDPLTRSIFLLGTLPNAQAGAAPDPAIITVQKTDFTAENVPSLLNQGIQNTKLIEANDVYTWLHGWLAAERTDPDVKINVICPATERHIAKYTPQPQRMVEETPEIYSTIVKPYIDGIPAHTIAWVYNILDHKKETEKILFEDPSPAEGFLILPDSKWDLKTLSTLYLVALTHRRDLRSLRDLTHKHIPMLKGIQREATLLATTKWGIAAGGLKFFIHYHPTYYHFHVHITSVEYHGLGGVSVDRAWLLDDVIALLELDSSEGPSIFQRMTLNYALGTRHPLFGLIEASND